MNIDCRVIGDLLPLYADESCSDASRALVDDHLKTCPRCRETLARMKSEQFLPAAQAIDPPAVADYAQKVKHRRQKRGTLLTVGVIVLIVLLSLAAAAWMNLVRAQHPYIPVVEESVCNLAAGEVQTFADSCDGRRLFTNSTRIAVTFRADTPQNGTITLWNITDVTKPYPSLLLLSISDCFSSITTARAVLSMISVTVIACRPPVPCLRRSRFMLRAIEAYISPAVVAHKHYRLL